MATTVEPVEAVYGGTEVDEGSFAADWSFVVGVGVLSEGVPRCTGSLVDELTVITAAHCVAPVAPVAPDTVWFGSAHIGSAQTRTIEAVEVNPLFDENALSNGNDSAILHLAPSSPATGVTPIRVVTRAEDGTLAAPMPVRFAGFGLTETGPTSVLHEATTTATRESMALWTASDVPNACSGDSGGPLITVLPSGEPVLVGVASFTGGVGCGDLGYWSNLGADDFIQDVFHPVAPPPPDWNLAYTATPTSGVAPLNVEFDMTGSGFVDGRSTTYIVAPDSEASQPVVVTSDTPVTSYTYTQPGTYLAYVGFTDGVAYHGDYVSIVVTSPVPTAMLSYTATPTSGEAPLTVAFDLAGSAMSDGSAAVYFIDPVWDGGQFDGETGDIPFTTTYTYTEPGTYQALVGLASTTVEASESTVVTITVTEPAPPPPPPPPFESPVDNDHANEARAGRTIPFRFTVTDDGGPVTGLSEVATTSTTYPCPTQVGGDAIESYAVGESGTLLDLGDGHYQYNWKTPKSWAGSCRTLTLDVGDGPRSADFEFTR